MQNIIINTTTHKDMVLRAMVDCNVLTCFTIYLQMIIYKYKQIQSVQSIFTQYTCLMLVCVCGGVINC